MADGIPSFSEKTNMARVIAGLKGPTVFFDKPMTPQPMQIVDGWAGTGYAEIQQATSFPQPTPTDVWNSRRSNGSI